MRMNGRRSMRLPPPMALPESEYPRSTMCDAFLDEIERRLIQMGLASRDNGGIDRDEREAGFSIDGAVDAFNMGLSVEQYLSDVVTRRANLKRSVA